MHDDLRLADYTDGYRFSCCCRVCGFTWYAQPAALMERPGMHNRMYLGEVEKNLKCLRTRDHKVRAGQHIRITPVRDRKDHHFIGGMA